MSPALWIRGDAEQHVSQVIREGIKGTEMPAYPHASDDSIRALIGFLDHPGNGSTQLMSGNERRGRDLFRSLACAGCHGTGGRGGLLGPELTAILRSKGIERLESAVRHPGKEIPFNYTQISVVTKDGRHLTGLRRNEDTFSLQLVDRSGNLHLLLKKELSTVTHERKSLMPSYDEGQLPASALSDLLAYLQNTKEPL